LFKPASVFIGLRYFFAGQRSALLVSFISLLAIAGLVLGVALLIIVLSVMNGFDRELRDNILSVVPHVQLIHQSGIEDWQSERDNIMQMDSVTNAVPYADAEGLMSHRQNARPVQLLGLSATAMPAGLASVLTRYNLAIPAQGRVLISEVIADALNAKTNQRVSMIFPAENGRSTTVYSFIVEGIFATHTELDQSLVIASLPQVAEIAGIPNRAQGFRLQVNDQFNARNIGFEIINQLPFGYGFRDWFQTHGNLYQAIQLSRNMVVLLIFLIVAIAAFNVISMLMMSVMNKRKDIAVLQTLGLSRGDIVGVFLVQGSMIGVVGIALGVLLGVLGCYFVPNLVSWFEAALGAPFLDTEVYPIDYIPVDMRWTDVSMIAGVALMLNIVATIYPALRASRTVPADELRYE
jgi:lipoprotein-releasing system permease protein|tara:strand:+ start:521 stop:1741 length:1221 start_codon:yes stop_codon:yes gene_type:complete